ncbi:hypothetical protein KEM56_000642 [Ascosphaera pollenicola]|nr:hypothetical protein KEM56_000642 [Ascosphaera pollenicola]
MGLNGRDMKRPDLIVPYVAPKIEDETDLGSTLSNTMPMAAMFTRNRIIAWTSVIFNLQQYLIERPEKRSPNSTPASLSVMMAVMSVIVTFMPLFFPTNVNKVAPPAATPSA